MTVTEVRPLAAPSVGKLSASLTGDCLACANFEHHLCEQPCSCWCPKGGRS